MEHNSIYRFATALRYMSWENIFDVMVIPCCTLLIAFVLGIVLNRLLLSYLDKRFDLDELSMKYAILQAMRGLPLSWSVATALYILVNSTDINYHFTQLLSYLLTIWLGFSVFQVFARAITGIVDVYASRNEHMPRTTLLTNILNVIIYSAGILLILGSLGISIAPLLTALGVGGMAVALGLQETLANICAGLYLLMSRQLRIDDYIRLSTGEEGKVSDITWRFTTIMSIAGNAIVVPNQKISSAIITNYCMPEQDMSIKIKCGVAYNSDLDKVEEVTLQTAREVMEAVDGTVTKEPTLRFHTFNDSSIDFNVILHCSEFANQFTIKHEFIKAITKRYRQEGIVIPFPIRTIINKDSNL